MSPVWKGRLVLRHILQKHQISSRWRRVPGKTVKELDIEQYKLVDEALRERSIFLNIAPHLTDQLPIIFTHLQVKIEGV